MTRCTCGFFHTILGQQACNALTRVVQVEPGGQRTLAGQPIIFNAKMPKIRKSRAPSQRRLMKMIEENRT